MREAKEISDLKERWGVECEEQSSPTGGTSNRGFELEKWFENSRDNIKNLSGRAHAANVEPIRPPPPAPFKESEVKNDPNNS